MQRQQSPLSLLLREQVEQATTIHHAVRIEKVQRQLCNHHREVPKNHYGAIDHGFTPAKPFGRSGVPAHCGPWWPLVEKKKRG